MANQARLWGEREPAIPHDEEAGQGDHTQVEPNTMETATAQETGKRVGVEGPIATSTNDYDPWARWG